MDCKKATYTYAQKVEFVCSDLNLTDFEQPVSIKMKFTHIHGWEGIGLLNKAKISKLYFAGLGSSKIWMIRSDGNYLDGDTENFLNSKILLEKTFTLLSLASLDYSSVAILEVVILLHFLIVRAPTCWKKLAIPSKISKLFSFLHAASKEIEKKIEKPIKRMFSMSSSLTSSFESIWS